MRVWIALTMLLCLCKVSYAGDVEINLDIIADIESSSDPLAYNNGHYGEYQISQDVLYEYDNATGEMITNPENLFDAQFSRTIADWYFNKRIPEVLKGRDIPDTITTRIIAYNWGIGHLRKWYRRGSNWNQLSRETRNYIKKYFRELKEAK